MNGIIIQHVVLSNSEQIQMHLCLNLNHLDWQLFLHYNLKQGELADIRYIKLAVRKADVWGESPRKKIAFYGVPLNQCALRSFVIVIIRET